MANDSSAVAKPTIAPSNTLLTPGTVLQLGSANNSETDVTESIPPSDSPMDGDASDVENAPIGEEHAISPLPEDDVQQHDAANEPKEGEPQEVTDHQVEEAVEEPKVEDAEDVQPRSNYLQHSAKISGYLEKKGKLRMVSSWKKYWFVLEGRLLLYYRSRTEYDTLSPCKGSITLGAPCNIKPGPASHCVFQIETRNNTITLRAENRAEQDKWMLAILGALNQSASVANQTKLSHFRYSADDLALRAPNDKPTKPTLTRQNTLPERLKETTKQASMYKKLKRKEKVKAKEKAAKEASPELLEATPSKTMVERLQSIGAISYTAGVGQEPAKVAKGSPKLPKNENLRKLLDKQEITPDNWILEEEPSANNGEACENELYVQLKNDETTKEVKEADSSNEHVEEVVVENQHYECSDDLPPPLEQVTPRYIEKHIYQEIVTNVGSSGEHVNDVVEYCQIDPLDHNKNKVEYFEPVVYATSTESSPVHYATVIDEPELPPRPNNIDASSEVKERSREQSKEKEKEEKASRVKRLAKMVQEERKEGKEGKRQSFVVRMFKKIKKQDSKEKERSKSQDTCNDTSEDCESTQPADGLTIDEGSSVVQGKPVERSDVNSELVMELKEVLVGLTQEGQEVNVTKVEENPTDEGGDTQDNISDAATDEWVKEDMPLEEGGKEKDEEDGASPTPPETEATSPQLRQLEQLHQPQLPLKQRQQVPQQAIIPNQSAPIHDFDYDIYDSSQRLNIPRPKLISKSKRTSKRAHTLPSRTLPVHYIQHDGRDDSREDRLVTIDEILDDLENQHYEPFSRQKVKQLIEKFNENEAEVEREHSDDEVQLRHPRVSRPTSQNQELGSLLDQLDKVAGKTGCNLGINEPFTEEQWKNNAAMRKRRLSDPDYDIPRPHSALQILPSAEKSETKMQPTRFFGPVIMDQINGDASCATSITPDSLEVDTGVYQQKNYTPSIEEDRSMRSYTSHIYTSSESHQLHASAEAHNSHPHRTLAPGPIGGVGGEKEEIYAKPKSLSSLIVAKTECERAFYLAEDNDNTIVGKDFHAPGALQEDCNGDEEEKSKPTVDGGHTGNSMCLDSLEPFQTEEPS